MGLQLFECWTTDFNFQDDSLIKNFLDNTLASRLATRMLCEHHLFLHEEKVSDVFLLEHE